MGELVELWGADGRPTGEVVDRATMRRHNLRHAATGIVVLNPRGEIYVHRRTATKDVYPGMYDFCAGGVVQAGEHPVESARRELAEELGVVVAQLDPLGEADFEDAHARYHAFLFSVTYEGEIVHQPDEVEWGAWVTPGRLLEMLDEFAFVPDAPTLLRPWLEARA